MLGASTGMFASAGSPGPLLVTVFIAHCAHRAPALWNENCSSCCVRLVIGGRDIKMAHENMTFDLLESRAFPAVGQAVRIHHDQILCAVEEAVRQMLPGADELTLTQVRDHIPAVLDRFAKALESDQPAETDILRDASLARRSNALSSALQRSRADY